MHTKKHHAFAGVASVALAASFFFVPLSVSAQSLEKKPGITPESPLYVLDTFLEGVQEFFAFRSVARARLNVQFAAERNAEIQEMLATHGTVTQGIEIAESRLQRNLARAVSFVGRMQVEDGDEAILEETHEDLSTLAESLQDTVKQQELDLVTQIRIAKAALREAKLQGDAVRVTELEAQIADLEAQKDALTERRDSYENEFERHQDELEDEMSDGSEAQSAIRNAERKRLKIQTEADKEGITLAGELFTTFDGLLADAKTAYGNGEYLLAKNLAKEARRSLKEIDSYIDDFEEAADEHAELDEDVQDIEDELDVEESDDTLTEEQKQEQERVREEEKQRLEMLREEQKQAEEDQKRAEETLREQAQQEAERLHEEQKQERERTEEQRRQEEEAAKRLEEQQREQQKQMNENTNQDVEDEQEVTDQEDSVDHSESEDEQEDEEIE